MKRTLTCIALLALSTPCLALEMAMPHTADDLGCTNCHAMNHKVVGPAWLDVARRYRATRDDPATFDMLVKKVSRGGVGDWGKVPMIASDPAGRRQGKIQELVKAVLALGDRLPGAQAKN